MAEAQDDNVTIGHHVVLLVDVLNQRDLIRRLEKLPPNDAGRADYVSALKKSAGSVIGVRGHLEKFFTSFVGVELAPMMQSLSPQQRVIYDQYRDFKLQTQSFSDTVVVYSPLLNPTGNLGMRGVYALLCAAGSTILTCLAGKVSIRGGLDVGVALELGDRDLYGPAFVHAYELEQTVAQYPRIVVGNEFVQYLQNNLRTPGTDPLTELDAATADVCLQVLARDLDGACFIDFLGKQFRTMVGDVVSRDLAEQAAVFVREEHERFVETQNHKLASRYGWLRQYVEDRLSDWK